MMESIWRHYFWFSFNKIQYGTQDQRAQPINAYWLLVFVADSVYLPIISLCTLRKLQL